MEGRIFGEETCPRRGVVGVADVRQDEGAFLLKFVAWFVGSSRGVCCGGGGERLWGWVGDDTDA